MDASWETVFFLAHFVRFLRSKVFVPKYTQLYNIPLSMVYFKKYPKQRRSFHLFLVAQGDDILKMGDFLPAITLNDDVESISAGKHHTCAVGRKNIFHHFHVSRVGDGSPKPKHMFLDNCMELPVQLYVENIGTGNVLLVRSKWIFCRPYMGVSLNGGTQQPWENPTKNDHFGMFWGYHHLRKHPYK